MGAFGAKVIQSREDTNSAAVWWNLGALDPSAVGIFVEIVPGFDRRIHIGDDDAVGRGLASLLGEGGE